MSTISISNLRANLYTAADQIIDSHKPLTVTSKRGDLILMSAEDYESMQETMHVLATMPGIISDVRAIQRGETIETIPYEDLGW